MTKTTERNGHIDGAFTLLYDLATGGKAIGVGTIGRVLDEKLRKPAR